MLTGLAVQYTALQLLDVHSTLRALDRGYAEGNPLMAPMASNRAAFVALKTASTAVTLYTAHRLWKKNRMAAIGVMLGLNGLYTAIVARNYRLTRP